MKTKNRRIIWIGLLIVTACVTGIAFAQAAEVSTHSFTNTANRGSHPETMIVAKTAKGVVTQITVDVSALPADTQVYRATFVPNRRGHNGATWWYSSPIQQIKVESADDPGVFLGILGPRYLTLDATDAVRRALQRQDKKLVLNVINFPYLGSATTFKDVNNEYKPYSQYLDHTTKQAVLRLDVTCDQPAQSAITNQALNVSAIHKDGDTMITWTDPTPLIPANVDPNTVTGGRVRDLSKDAIYNTDGSIKEAGANNPNEIRFRVYRSNAPITKDNIHQAQLVDEANSLTMWDWRFRGHNESHFAAWPSQVAPLYPVATANPSTITLARPDTGIYVRKARAQENAYYAVVRAIDGAEDFSNIACSNQVSESTGTGMTLLRQVQTMSVSYIKDSIVNFYVRWEAPPYYNLPNEPFDYMVAVPPVPAPAQGRGININLYPDAGWIDYEDPWWYGAKEEGSMRVGTNTCPHDWWLANHENYDTLKPWTEGTVQPFIQRRINMFIEDCVKKNFPVDPNRIMVAGSCYGGTSLIWGMRSGDLFSHAIANITQFVIPTVEGAPNYMGYWKVFGKPEWNTIYDGTNVSPFEHLNSIKWVMDHPKVEAPLIIYEGGGSGSELFKPAWEFTKALIDTKRAFVFKWEAEPHYMKGALFPAGGTRYAYPGMIFRKNASLPAFSCGSLDDQLGGTYLTSSVSGQMNYWYLWETETVVDTPNKWEMTVFLPEKANTSIDASKPAYVPCPSTTATADITPRRIQNFAVIPGNFYEWTNTQNNSVVQSGIVKPDADGFITLFSVIITKDKNRITLQPASPGTPIDTTPPAGITDLSIANSTDNSITLSWTAPGNDGNVGQAAKYDLRYSLEPITDANWESAAQILSDPVPLTAGTNQTFKALGLKYSTTYYLAMKTYDSLLNYSALSNVVNGLTAPPFPAFPGAEGFGILYTTGGRGGKVVHVTRLDDPIPAVPGTFRYAMENEPDRRIIVFDVGGTIVLKQSISVPYGNYTIAGQTAPGGISIQGANLWLVPYTNGGKVGNFILRHLHLRGCHYDRKHPDSMRQITIDTANNFILDHLSMTGGGDQLSSMTGCSNFTVQWCTFEESALSGQGGASHSEANHQHAMLFGTGAPKVSIHHNLFAHHYKRAPEANYLYAGAIVDFRNNLVYDWGQIATRLGAEGAYNIIGNCWLSGPRNGTPNNARTEGWPIQATKDVYPPLETVGTTKYIPGNIWFNNKNDPSAVYSTAGVPIWTTTTSLDAPCDAPPVTTETAEEAYESVLNFAGAWPQDATTRRTIQEVRTRTGSMGLNGPYEYFGTRIGPCSEAFDRDRDGMPDTWETSHGLNPDDPEDRNNIVPASESARHAGYTYVEYYINELADSLVGQSGQTYSVNTNVTPAGAGNILAEVGVVGWEYWLSGGGYNAQPESGNVNFGNAVLNEGSSVVMKIEPKPGYVFSHWQGGPVDGLTATEVKFIATSNADITAVFIPKQPCAVDVEITDENGIAGDFGGAAGTGAYGRGDIVTLAAYSNNGYKFLRWHGGPIDGVEHPSVQFIAQDAVTIQAQFTLGDGGDLVIDDFNDRDTNSFLTYTYTNSTGEQVTGVKQWVISNVQYYDVPNSPGNVAIKGHGGYFTLNSGRYFYPDQCFALPAGTTVFKMKVYNIGTQDAVIDSSTVREFSFAKNINNSWVNVTSGLRFNHPFKLSVIKPGESAIIALPLCLLKDVYMTKGSSSPCKFNSFNFWSFVGTGTWGTATAVDDFAFGKAWGTDPTLDNLPPMANAGPDQVTKDFDRDGKEEIMLNAGDSYDRNADVLTTVVWKEGATQIATGFFPRVILPVGSHDITLTVTDESGAISQDTVTITILEPGQTSHIITATATAGGTIDPSGAVTIDEGLDQAFTLTPATGYHIADIKADNQSKSKPSYTFPSVMQNHTIEAIFARLGDVNSDGLINVRDLILVARAFGKQFGDTGYDPRCDQDDNNRIDIKDLLIVARHFGQ